MSRYSVKYVSESESGFTGYYNTFQEAISHAESIDDKYNTIFIFKDGQFHCQYDPQKDYE